MSAATSSRKATTTFSAPPLTDGTDAITWMSSQPWSNGKVGTIGCSSTAEWQLGVAAQGESGIRGHDPAGIRRGRGTRGAVLRAGQLVSRRRGADAVHRVDLWRAEPGAADVSAQHFAGGSDPRRRRCSIWRSSCRRWIGRRRWSICRRRTSSKPWTGRTEFSRIAMEVSTGGAMIKRTPNDPAWYRGGLWHDDMNDQRAGILVHVVVRRFHRPESGGV